MPTPVGYTVEYNKVTIDRVLFRSYDQTEIRNGPDYLYTENELHCVGVINDDTVFGDPKGGRISVLEKDTEYKRLLTLPRKSLTVKAPDGRTVWMTAEPSKNPNWGPEPLYANIVEVIGQGTLFVEFGLKWCSVIEAPGNAASFALLSNRWVMTHTIDRYFRLTVAVQGRAVFRADVLVSKPRVMADQFRKAIVMSPRKGFKRDVLSCVLSQDSLAIEYEFFDRQMSVDILSPIIADVAIKTTVRTAFGGAAGVVQGVAQLASAAATVAGAIAVPVMAGNLTNVPGTLFDALSKFLPQATFNASIAVFGTPDAPMGPLMNQAIDIALAYSSNWPVFVAGTGLELTQDPVARIVAYTATYQVNPIELVAFAPFLAGGALGEANAIFVVGAAGAAVAAAGVIPKYANLRAGAPYMEENYPDAVLRKASGAVGAANAGVSKEANESRGTGRASLATLFAQLVLDPPQAEGVLSLSLDKQFVGNLNSEGKK
jgi:hypothetical protein